MKKALIYCRVSSQQQVNEWHWLSSQEKRCFDYAVSKWLEVEKSFLEEWISWAVLDRKSLNELLKYIDSHKKEEYIVIFDDLKRIARDVSIYLKLKQEFKARGVHFESPNFKFEDTPEWRFIEVIMAGQAELEREQNRRQVIQKQRARIELGYWCFVPPTWFRYELIQGHGKMLVQDERARYIRLGFERFANEEYFTASDLARYLIKKGLTNVATVGKNDSINSMSVLYRMLNNPLYAGYLELESWDIPLQKAKHEWMISFQTYLKIQDRMNQSNSRKAAVERKNERNDISADFPLRGFLYCEESGNSLSGAWSQWKSTRVPYYTYPRTSPMKWKSINRDKFHKEFEEYIYSLIPNTRLINLFKLIFTDEVEKRRNNQEQEIENTHKEIAKLRSSISKYFTRIRSTESTILIEWYEKEIEKLENDIKNLEKNLKIPNGRKKNVWTLLNEILKDVYDAKKLWKSSKLESQIKLLKSIFPEGIPINKNRGIWTPKLSLTYQAFEHWKMSKNQMVELVGFEPTSWKAHRAHLLS